MRLSGVAACDAATSGVAAGDRAGNEARVGGGGADFITPTKQAYPNIRYQNTPNQSDPGGKLFPENIQVQAWLWPAVSATLQFLQVDGLVNLRAGSFTALT